MCKRFLVLLIPVIFFFHDVLSASEESLLETYPYIFEFLPYGVYVKEGENAKPKKILWGEATEQNIVSEITEFEDINWLLSKGDLSEKEITALSERVIALPESLKLVDDNKLHLLWSAETNAFASNNRSYEPSYLHKISNSLGLRIKQFSKEKEPQTKEELTKHAYSLLFVMCAYCRVCRLVMPPGMMPPGSAYGAAYDAAWDAAWDAARYAALDAAYDAA